MKKTSLSIDMEDGKAAGAPVLYREEGNDFGNGAGGFSSPTLYEKYVPAQTREYIESMEEPAEPRPHQTPAPHSGRYAHCGERGGGVIGLCFYRTLAGQAPACRTGAGSDQRRNHRREEASPEQLNGAAQRVPLEQQEKIQQALDAERLESQRNAEASARYAGLHITENGQEHYLSTKSGQEFLDMAILMRRYVRGTFGDKEKGFARCIYGAEEFHLSGLSSWPHGGWRISAKSPVWWRSTLTKEFSPPSILWMAGRASGSKMCPPPPLADKSGHVNKEVAAGIFSSPGWRASSSPAIRKPRSSSTAHADCVQRKSFSGRDLRARRPIELLHGLLFDPDGLWNPCRFGGQQQLAQYLCRI